MTELEILVRSQKLNRRQLALRAAAAQHNAAVWRAKGPYWYGLAESCNEAARVHLFLLIEKGPK